MCMRIMIQDMTARLPLFIYLCIYLFIFVVSTSDTAFYEADKYKYLGVFYGSMKY